MSERAQYGAVQLRAVAPELDVPVIAIAEEQEEYLTIYAGLVRQPAYPVAPGMDWNSMVFAFRPDEGQRARIARGEDVYLSLLTFGRPMPGVIVTVGKHDTAAVYNVMPTPTPEPGA